jgi:peptide/nickel transport system ATP-binding protein/oligopeptide transport system ATP-binding protein
MSLLEIKNLKTHFFTDRGVVKAVDGVNLSVEKGEAVGIVGESGCGKSVTALSILRLIPEPPGKIVEGEIILQSENDSQPIDLVKLPEKRIRGIRGRRIAMIFQEPMTALNPVFTVGDQISEALFAHKKIGKKEAWDRTVELLKLVGIPAPEYRYKNYPHELSGGMRQRVMIAMGLILNPEILIADEPTTALDVTIQAQILELLTELKERLGMAVLLITHDMGVIAETVKKVAVMYSGRIVELATTEEIFNNPLHPYTIGLLGAIPPLEKKPKGTRLPTIPGMVPDLINVPKGCLFRERCSKAQEDCAQSEPKLEEINPGHWVRCYHYK